MNIEEIRNKCLELKGVTEELPFGPDNLVFKVMGKMFLLLPLDSTQLKFNYKGNPDVNDEYRAEYPFITGAWHMNKTHWNTITIDYGVKSALVFELIEESYRLVAAGLTKKLKTELENL